MPPAASDYRRLYLQDIKVFFVKNHDSLRDHDASHSKLARSVLKIAPFEFANLKYFKVHSWLTFKNLKNARLVLNACEMLNTAVVVFTLIVSDLSICDKQNVVQVVAFSIYMLTSNEEI